MRPGDVVAQEVGIQDGQGGHRIRRPIFEDDLPTAEARHILGVVTHSHGAAHGPGLRQVDLEEGLVVAARHPDILHGRQVYVAVEPVAAFPVSRVALVQVAQDADQGRPDILVIIGLFDGGQHDRGPGVFGQVHDVGVQHVGILLVEGQERGQVHGFGPVVEVVQRGSAALEIHPDGAGFRTVTVLPQEGVHQASHEVGVLRVDAELHPLVRPLEGEGF